MEVVYSLVFLTNLYEQLCLHIHTKDKRLHVEALITKLGLGTNETEAMVMKLEKKVVSTSLGFDEFCKLIGRPDKKNKEDASKLFNFFGTYTPNYYHYCLTGLGSFVLFFLTKKPTFPPACTHIAHEVKESKEKELGTEQFILAMISFVRFSPDMKIRCK